MAFYVVYIEEAHPTDLWQVGANERDGVLFSRPTSDSVRGETATACVRKLGIEIPALLDGMENAAEKAYTGWPDRLYLIDKEGLIAFKSAPGPFGFSPRGLAAALAAL